MAVVRQFILACLCPSAPRRRNIPTSGCDANDRAPGTYAFCTGSGDPSGTLAAGNPHNGEFEFSSDNGPVIANHRVEIEATEFQGFAIDDEAAFAAAAEATGESPVAVNPVPAIYNSQTILTTIVKDMDGQSFMFGFKTEQ